MLEENLLIFVFFCSVTLFVVMTYNSSKLYAFFMAILGIYTLFPMVAQVNYPLGLAYVYTVSYPVEYFYSYYKYSFVFFCSLFLTYQMMLSFRSSAEVGFEFQKNYIKQFPTQLVFGLLALLYAGGLLFFLLKNIHELSYANQALLKSNRIWSFMFSFSGVWILVLLSNSVEFHNLKASLTNRIWNWVLLGVIASVTLATALAAGQRIQLFSITLSLVYFYCAYTNFSLNPLTWLQHKKMFSIILLFMIVSQLIRSTRSVFLGNEALDVIQFTKLFLRILNPEFLTFQDYSTPAFTLVTVMHDKIIEPLQILHVGITNLFSFFFGGIPSMGEELARHIDPYGVTGYGYHILTESYTAFGILGCILFPACLAVFFYLFECVFCRGGNNTTRVTLQAFFSYYFIDMIRGSAFFVFKGFLYYFIAGVILMMLSQRLRVVFRYHLPQKREPNCY